MFNECLSKVVSKLSQSLASVDSQPKLTNVQDKNRVEHSCK